MHTDEPRDPNDPLTTALRDMVGSGPGGTSLSPGCSWHVSVGYPVTQWWDTPLLLGPWAKTWWSKVGLGTLILAVTLQVMAHIDSGHQAVLLRWQGRLYCLWPVGHLALKLRAVRQT